MTSGDVVGCAALEALGFVKAFSTRLPLAVLSGALSLDDVTLGHASAS